MGGLASLRGGGMAPGFSGTPLAGTGGRSGRFFAFLCAAGLGEGDVEKDRDLERLPLKELRCDEWLEYELNEEEWLRERDDPDPV